jgi:hypothetical protein
MIQTHVIIFPARADQSVVRRPRPTLMLPCLDPPIDRSAIGGITRLFILMTRLSVNLRSHRSHHPASVIVTATSAPILPEDWSQIAPDKRALTAKMVNWLKRMIRT